MNAEVVKAMNRKKKNSILSKWWSKNGYKIMRVVLFPIWIVIVIYEKIDYWLDCRNLWSEKRANEILSYYIPRKAHWNAESKTFHFSINNWTWSVSNAKKYLKRKDRRFWLNHSSLFGGNIHSYLVNSFELEGFTKKIEKSPEFGTEIIFTLIKENS